MLTKYLTFPTRSKFREDTGRKHLIKAMNKKSDALLDKMDDYLGDIEMGRRGTSLFGFLYLATDSWLWNPHNQGRTDQHKYVDALFRVTVQKLCNRLGVEGNVQNLKQAFETYWGDRVGRELDEEKRNGDNPNYVRPDGTPDPGVPNVLLPDDELMKRRVVFKNGRAYMWDWYNQGTPDRYKLVRANTSNVAGSCITPGYAGYVMRVDNQLFMAHHREGREEGGKFAHSAYTDGDRVLCAGEIAIIDGRIKAITTASGHYQPQPQHLLRMLHVLIRQGVPTAEILLQVLTPGQTRYYDCRPFLTAGGNLDRLEPSRRVKEVYQQIPGWIEGMVRKNRELNQPYMQPGDRLVTADDIWQAFE